MEIPDNIKEILSKSEVTPADAVEVYGFLLVNGMFAQPRPTPIPRQICEWMVQHSDTLLDPEFLTEFRRLKKERFNTQEKE